MRSTTDDIKKNFISHLYVLNLCVCVWIFIVYMIHQLYKEKKKRRNSLNKRKKVAKDNDKSFLHLLQIVIYLILVLSSPKEFLHFLFFFWYSEGDYINMGSQRVITSTCLHVVDGFTWFSLNYFITQIVSLFSPVLYL